MKSIATLLCLTALVIVGCGQTTVEPLGESGVSNVSLKLCEKCGEVAGAEACCAPGAETCACSMHKGSPGCCLKVAEGTDLALCTTCGFLQGDEQCCSKENEVCTKCGWHKGSLVCCKIDKEAALKLAQADNKADDKEEESEENVTPDADGDDEEGEENASNDGEEDNSDEA